MVKVEAGESVHHFRIRSSIHGDAVDLGSGEGHQDTLIKRTNAPFLTVRYHAKATLIQACHASRMAAIHNSSRSLPARTDLACYALEYMRKISSVEWQEASKAKLEEGEEGEKGVRALLSLSGILNFFDFFEIFNSLATNSLIVLPVCRIKHDLLDDLLVGAIGVFPTISKLLPARYQPVRPNGAQAKLTRRGEMHSWQGNAGISRTLSYFKDRLVCRRSKGGLGAGKWWNRLKTRLMVIELNNNSSIFPWSKVPKVAKIRQHLTSLYDI